jgi:uracil-DNA glycosylase
MALCRPVGNPNAKIVLLGEAPGEDEERTGVPFVGASGRELRACLAEAGIEDVPHRYGTPSWSEARNIYILNVFAERPPANNLEKWQVGKSALPLGYNLPPMARGKFLAPDKVHHVEACKASLSQLRPNLIVALGGTALWALSGLTGISNYRGAIVPSPFGKVLPTFHPAAILRQWGNRPILLADLEKARLHSESPEYSRPSRKLLIQPTIEEVEDFATQHLGPFGPAVSVDVETKARQITCLAFAPSPNLGICIPFVDETQPGNSYWSLDHELRAWRVVRQLLSGPREVIFQNGAYDVQYFLHHRIPVRNFRRDTMVRQHASFPELPKALGFLGSIHTDEPAWKLMRRQKADTEKREE